MDKRSAAKDAYFSFRNSDYGHPFHEYLGIERPRIEYQWSKVRMTVFRNGQFITGDWCATIKEAKASYKAKLPKPSRCNCCGKFKRAGSTCFDCYDIIY
jgi:hypothetical protein